MEITQPNLDALRTEFSLDYQKAYDATEVWAGEIATEIPSSTKSNTYGWIEKLPTLRKWVGPRVANNLKEQKYVLENEPYEGTIELDLDDVEDDNLGMYKAMVVPSLGQAVKKNADQLIAAILKDNTALAYDGQPLFSDSHVIGKYTYDNDFALALTADNFSEVWAAMVAFKGEDGQPLGVLPNKLFVAPQLKKTALEIVNATIVANAAGTAGVSNVLQGWADVVVLEERADSPTFWALADCRKPIKPIVHQVRKPAQFIARDQLTDPKVFEKKVLTYGVDGRWAVGITLPFLIARGNS